MAHEGNEGQNRRMDLNLYLGLPRSPRRAESDLGSDLALGSLPIPGEGEIRGSTDMSGYAEASDSHAPYSPSHASYSPNPQTVEPLDSDENSPFEYSDYSPQPAYPTVAQSMEPGDEPPVHEGQSHLEYNPYSPSYIPVSPAVEDGLEPQSNDFIDPIDHALYSPIYVPASTVEHDGETMDHEDSNHIEYVPYSPSYVVPASFSPTREPDESMVQDNDPHAPYIPDIPTTQVHSDALREEIGFVAYQTATQTREALRRELLQSPQVRFRRLIESTRRWRLRRFRSSVPYRFGPDMGAFSSGSRPLDDETPAERSPEAHCGAQKTSLEGHAAEDLEEEKEQVSVGANFDCNICLDVAKEPVVTSCGHLFCWPCLYQWLHLHCDHKECPVCKGEVVEAKIIPIYGRGSSEMEADKKGQEDGDSGLKVPPRPHGQRFESLRQRMRRPLRRAGEERGSWRVILGEEAQNENRVDRQDEPVSRGVFDAANRRMITRLMEVQRLQGVENLQSVLNLWGSGPSRNATEMDSDHAQGGNSPSNPYHGREPRSSSPALARHGISFLPRHTFFSSASDRLAAIAADASSERMRNSGNHSGASTSASPRVPNLVNVQGPREAALAADQASASSTMAVIQGDARLPVDAPAEPNSVGSSHTPRRRRRNSVAGSLDADGGVHQARKRRRLN